MVVHYGGIAFDHSLFQTMRLQWEPENRRFMLNINVRDGKFKVAGDTFGEIEGVYTHLLQQLYQASGRIFGQEQYQSVLTELRQAFRGIQIQLREQLREQKDEPKNDEANPQNSGDHDKEPGGQQQHVGRKSDGIESVLQDPDKAAEGANRGNPKGPEG